MYRLTCDFGEATLNDAAMSRAVATLNAAAVLSCEATSNALESWHVRPEMDRPQTRPPITPIRPVARWIRNDHPNILPTSTMPALALI